MKVLPISLRSPPYYHSLKHIKNDQMSLSLKAFYHKSFRFRRRTPRRIMPPLSRLVHMMICPENLDNDTCDKNSQLCQNVPWLPEISNHDITGIKRREKYHTSLTEKAIHMK